MIFSTKLVKPYYGEKIIGPLFRKGGSEVPGVRGEIWDSFGI
jgi:hypothetical protein